MGMGFKSISEYKADPVFQTLVADGETSSPVFAFKLASSGAELSVGGTDSSLYTGSFTYAKVEQEGYWQVALDGISVSGKKAVSNADSIIDTGTTVSFFRFSELWHTILMLIILAHCWLKLIRQGILRLGPRSEGGL